MTLLFLDGFDNYNSSARMVEKWDTLNDGYGSSPLSGGRTAGYLLLTNGFNGPIKIFTPDAHATVIAGFALNKRNNGGHQDVVFFSSAGTQQQCGVQFYANGTIIAYRSDQPGIGPGVVLAQTRQGMCMFDGWDYYEILVTLSATVGVMTIRRNNEVIMNLTGINNKFLSGTTIDGVMLQTYAGSPGFDDLYICNGAGSAPHNTFLGDSRVRMLTPSANGGVLNFTPSTGSNYQNVDEVPANTTDYNSGTTDGDQDVYVMTDLTEPSGSTIYGVLQSVYAAKSDAGTKYVRDTVRPVSTAYMGASQALSTTYKQFTQLHVTNPETSAAWTVAELNAAQFGAMAKDS